MLQNQIAGRHGSYATQFWRSSVAPHYRSRAAMRVAVSRKAINRRLVLPLDSHNWMRSLEVLNARYARRGRTPEHYQAVVRDMVEHHGAYAELTASTSASPTTNLSNPAAATAADSSALTAPVAADVLPAIDSLRDKAYAGEIPSNASLWVTLVWAYCTLQQPQVALDTFHQARRRFRFSLLTLQHMAELLLPVLCRHGELEAATALYEELLQPSVATEGRGNSQQPPSPPVQRRRSAFDDTAARRWLAEAAARQGDLRKTKGFAAAPADVQHGASEVDCAKDEMATESRHRPTINSLFHDAESTTTDAKKTSSASTKPQKSQSEPQQQQLTKATRAPYSANSTLPVLSLLSPVAVRRLFQSLCRESSTAGTSAAVPGEAASRYLTDAVSCWEHLYGLLPTASASSEASIRNDVSRSLPPKRATPPIQDVHELLNLYAFYGRWEAVLDFFSVAFLHRASSTYLTAAPKDLVSWADGIAAVAAAEEAEETLYRDTSAALLFPYDAELPLDAVTLNLVFACLPKAADPLRLCTSTTTKERGGQVLALPAAARPVTVVRLLDDLLTYRDDMQLTDVVMAAVGPALLQVGQHARLFELLARTPMMVRARERKAALQLSASAQELKSLLASLGYAAYALCRSEERRLDMVRCMPHLFPPEVVRRFAASAEADVSSSLSPQRKGACAACLPLAVLEGPVVAMSGGNALASSRVGESPFVPCLASTQSASASKTAAAAAMTATSLLDRRWQLFTEPAHSTQTGGARFHASGAAHATKRRAAHRSGRSSATLTSLAEDAMRRDYLRLQDTRHAAFTGSHADADRDPRPIPKGLHDHASGWDFFGRGGEKVFANHKRTPHPLTMRPKVMRDLRNPYRGWNPRRNSSLAHKENVVKWNGKSAV
ncbi:putative mitochondrial hypothetical protein [Leptomonas pyrrhocoris]|uniref:Uncharacterized protein n=1 Tax=Leptomonas pyrrhocoris TaxID=157538 RepID=A0A0N0DZT0_LEPPY|nr:putative mitochondrial hypothetical protein [Leptomonas pyrrhocoris]KPA85651.1 putative mitochondrial hypothetical protein [Leptomonas pyrrhocoris]|eukprot:XP_015664090.1 putative mitochondrial hypothetical protein [Leptomonas pyrrhocoris]